ncbi:iron ABC transporter permease [Enterovibrio norvegicus]|uniref:ABC transporter permease n=2 Tax=Enterovibrio norvegicus TaxID=188144 RepID=A0A2N7LCD2_9GAMM|nr:iron ABC transporter permease [Enterovibrio norvegicus]MCC4799606.1 iron ABC transporter permease [Enterovibrio norvegicus]OEE65691.1 iron ABC transporter permease [Enterovibrio norvegicus]OEF57604.1 iron ABC transporter permease [Enterovibrio norvegicus]OEF61127.1 iron ABC transporter permease [Enterovibrio norvegicus]PMH67123.1 iron ABC transporter permease [Enterovibrio norvegicus]
MLEQNRFLKTSSWVFSLLLVLPILAIFYTAVGESDDVFGHLMSTVMGTYTLNTVLLVAGTVFLSLLMGIPSAWLMANYCIPGDRWLQWALVLPLAMPGYIVGYIYTDWFDYAGPIQLFLRDVTGWTSAAQYWFPDLRTLPGASFVLALVLHPYVYLLARAAFMEQNLTLTQSARLLGSSPMQSFMRVSLPLARPAIAVGASLVAMEALGDFGTVNYFAVSTLTTAVYDTWLGYSNLNAAAKISAIMLVVIFLLISSERYSRRKQKLFSQNVSADKIAKAPLQGKYKVLATVWCWGLFAIAFLAPLGQLLIYAWDYHSSSSIEDFIQYSFNSLYVSSIAAVIALAIALLVNFYRRFSATPASNVPLRMSSLGYAVPGTVLAIGVLISLTSIDHAINDVAKAMDWGRPGLLFSGTMFALLTAFVVRFSAVAIGSVESSLAKVSPSLDMAARTMGCNAKSIIKRVQLPLIRRGCLIAMLLVFIESMKELNAALLLRPFNFETLATYVFNYASDEHLEYAALPAILLVVVGLIPLIMINRSLEQSHS